MVDLEVDIIESPLEKDVCCVISMHTNSMLKLYNIFRAATVLVAQSDR